MKNNLELLETNLQTIKTLAKKRDAENWRFRTFLKEKNSKTVDKKMEKIYREVAQNIDCRTCGNCCRELTPKIEPSEFEFFTELLNYSTVEQYITEKLTLDDEEYCHKDMPCVFLKDNICTIYENRPANCKSYPHIINGNLTSRLMKVIENYSICPIVFNAFEMLKDELAFKRQ